PGVDRDRSKDGARHIGEPECATRDVKMHPRVRRGGADGGDERVRRRRNETEVESKRLVADRDSHVLFLDGCGWGIGNARIARVEPRVGAAGWASARSGDDDVFPASDGRRFAGGAPRVTSFYTPRDAGGDIGRS